MRTLSGIGCFVAFWVAPGDAERRRRHPHAERRDEKAPSNLCPIRGRPHSVPASWHLELSPATRSVEHLGHPTRQRREEKVPSNPAPDQGAAA